eukprot:jgi/Botrbrau1/21550/Bobra.174_2s0051.1
MHPTCCILRNTGSNRSELGQAWPCLLKGQNVRVVCNAQAKPYLFGEPKHPPCPTCELHSRYGSCMYWGGIPACRPREQAKLLDYFLNETIKGSAFAEGMMTLTPCDLWPFIRGRTLWLAGDSITQETMRAAECLFLPFWNGTVTRPSTNESAINRSMTHGQVPPWCFEMPENSRICHIRVNLPEKMVGEVMPVMEGLSVKPTDIFVYNSAVWINDEEEYRQGLQQFAAAYRQEHRRMPFMIWRDSSVQHFNTPTGDYSVKGSPPPCMPIGLNLTEDAIRLLPDGSLSSARSDLQVVLEGGWRNKVATPIMESLGIPIMHTWNQSLPLWWTKNHYNPKCGLDDYWCGDCTHACHPSMYQIWMYHLYDVLVHNQQRLARHFATYKPT